MSEKDWGRDGKKVKLVFKMAAKRAKMEEDPSVTVFREYLRVKTVQPNPDYGKYDGLLNVSKLPGFKLFNKFSTHPRAWLYLGLEEKLPTDVNQRKQKQQNNAGKENNNQQYKENLQAGSYTEVKP